MWILPPKIHAVLLVMFLFLAAFSPVLLIWLTKNSDWGMNVYAGILITLFVLNFTPSRGEKFSQQNWIE